MANFRMLKQEILEERVKYEQFYDVSRSLLAELRKVNRIRVDLDHFRNNADISRKILALKRLLRYRCPFETEFVLLDEEEYPIFCKEYNKEPNSSCHVANNKVVLKCEFSDEELAALLSRSVQE